MKTKETIKITVLNRVETVHEVELPCYRKRYLSSGTLYAFYKINGDRDFIDVQSISVSDPFPYYTGTCLANALAEGNIECSEMEWLDSMQLVINHLNKEVEATCKVETV